MSLSMTLYQLFSIGLTKEEQSRHVGTTNIYLLIFQGQKFTADLLPNGKIKSNETGQIFGSPSTWAIFCKKLVNPAKKSGCGWASVSCRRQLTH